MMLMRQTFVEGEVVLEDDNEGTEHIEKGKVYRIHDPNMDRKELKPVLGERYVDPAQLKFAICLLWGGKWISTELQK
ncbi:hypothetical protein CTI12_AA610550 [Artemisia annua]|uniref:Uncharacterized protein n=1 Tax=Artemisia annua TaxID=35608 RepID=A0A2U1KFE0_ARTAN|nr:hypothetical protein CTI12_AA610550 [Artemisia annua]